MAKKEIETMGGNLDTPKTVENGVVEVVPVTRVYTAKQLSDMHKGGDSFAKIGALIGRSGERVRKLVRGYDAMHEEAEQYEADKPLLLNALSKRIYDKIDDAALDKLSSRDRFIALGITEDKIRALKNPVSGGILGTWISVVHRSMQTLDVTPEAKEITG